MKAYGGSGGLAPLNLNIGCGSRLSGQYRAQATLPPPPVKEPHYPLTRRLGKLEIRSGQYGGADKSLARPRRQQANVSVRMT